MINCLNKFNSCANFITKVANSNKNINFKGIKTLSEDTLEKEQKFQIANSFNEENEGWIDFHAKNNKDILSAHYFVPNILNKPKVNIDDSFNADFSLEFVDDFEQANKEEETYIKPRYNLNFSPEVELVALVSSKNDDGSYVLKIDNFPENILFCNEEGYNVNIGDKIKLSASLNANIKND